MDRMLRSEKDHDTLSPFGPASVSLMQALDRPQPEVCTAETLNHAFPWQDTRQGAPQQDAAAATAHADRAGLFAGMYDGGHRSNLAAGLAPLSPAAGMAARGEFRGAPLRPGDALRSYSGFGAEDFVGPDDIRLRQIHKVAGTENAALQSAMREALAARGIDGVKVYGRAKSVESLYGKLLEKPGETIGNIKDISGTRADILVNRPGYAQHYQVQEAMQGGLGEGYELGKNYIKKPNPWGYTGRMHDFYKGQNVPVHEIQIGSSDLSQFIDWQAANATGQKRSIHDLTGYKGDLYGTKLSPTLEQQYPRLMREIAENDATGHTVAQNPELQAKVDGFKGQVQEGLPSEFLPKPEAPVSRWTQLKRLAGKGLGALGVLGGGLQAWAGAKELQGGKTAEGVADVSGGLANVASGGAMLLGRAALGTSLGGVAAGIDGVKDLYIGARDHNAEQAAVGGAKTTAGGMMLAGTATLNPVLAGAGALTYGGALVYEHRDAIKNLASRGAHWASDKAADAWDGAKRIGDTFAHWR